MHFSWPQATALSAALIGGVALPTLAHGQAGGAKPDSTPATAAEACQRTVRQSLAAQALHPVEVSFNGAPAEQPGLSNDSQAVLRGLGRWRAATGMRSFSYSCSVDPHNFDAVGLVMRDSTPVVAEAANSRPVADPDLSELSPAACESSAAEALKQRWPRVSQITFDPATRSIRQPSVGTAELHGRGRALPAPGSLSTFFGFDCAMDPRDGRVLHTSVSD